MSAWIAVGLTLLPGWVVARRRGATGARLVSETVLWGVLVTVAWMEAASLVHARWSPALLCGPAAAAVVVAALAPGRVRPVFGAPRPWSLVATVPAAVHAVILAATPSFGWDFRYSWALKGKVSALAGGHDWAWLSWPFHSFACVDYPPLWSDLIALGAVLGASPGATAALWQAVLVLALAATCWWAAAPAPAPLRALAAAAGAWVPVIFTPTVAYSGYAEPMLAFGVCVALAAVTATTEGTDGAWQVAAAGAAIAALTKNEGIAFALGLALAAWRVGGRRAVGIAAAVLVAVVGWRGVLARWGVTGYPNVFSPARMASRLVHLPATLVSVASWQLWGVLAVWALVVPGLGSRRLAGLRTAVAVWATAVLTAYLVSPFDLAWHLRTSLDRVLAVPLPAVIALAIGASAPRDPAAAQQPPA